MNAAHSADRIIQLRGIGERNREISRLQKERDSKQSELQSVQRALMIKEAEYTNLEHKAIRFEVEMRRERE